MALFEKLTDNGLGIDAKRYFLHLYGLEQFGSLSLGLLGRGFFGFALGLFCFSFLFVGVFATLGLGF
jgi:hypothetical protein